MLLLIAALLFVLIGVISSKEFRRTVSVFYNYLWDLLKSMGWGVIGIAGISVVVILVFFLFNKVKDFISSNISFTIHRPYYEPYTSHDIWVQFAAIMLILIPGFLYLIIKPFQYFVDSFISKLKTRKSISTKAGALIILLVLIFFIAVGYVLMRF